MSNYVKNVSKGLTTVFEGMGITFKHLFEKNVTVQYPDVHPTVEAGGDKMPSNARNRLILEPDLCNGCTSCSRNCPVNCITLETMRVLPTDPDQPTLRDGSKRKLWVLKYDIDFAKCCFCGLCTTVCPTESVHFTTEFEYSTYDRKELIYHFSDMSPEKVAEKKKMLADDAKAKAEKAAADKAAADKEAKANQ